MKPKKNIPQKEIEPQWAAVQKPLALFTKGGQFLEELKQGPQNPCRRMFGPGPAGTICKTCSHLRSLVYANSYFKCDLRMNTHGAKTDHRKTWPACGKYEEIK